MYLDTMVGCEKVYVDNLNKASVGELVIINNRHDEDGEHVMWSSAIRYILVALESF